MTIATEVAAVVAGLREEVCRLHAELTRWSLVVWTAGNVSARVPGRDLLVIKPSGVGYDELTPQPWWSPTWTATSWTGEPPVLGHRRARLRLPAPARGRRRGAHPLDVRDRLGRPRRADPVRADDDGRRVRRRDPGRAVRPDRRRLDRPRHRRDAARAPLPGGADAQPRRRSPSARRASRGQGRRDVRGRRAHRAHRPPARRAAAASRRHDIDALYDRYQNVYGQRPDHRPE